MLLQSNLKVIEDFVAANDWIHFLAQEKETLSSTSICLTVDTTPEKVKKMCALLVRSPSMCPAPPLAPPSLPPGRGAVSR